jgi:hypothetical protein
VLACHRLFAVGKHVNKGIELNYYYYHQHHRYSVLKYLDTILVVRRELPIYVVLLLLIFCELHLFCYILNFYHHYLSLYLGVLICF